MIDYIVLLLGIIGILFILGVFVQRKPFRRILDSKKRNVPFSYGSINNDLQTSAHKEVPTNIPNSIGNYRPQIQDHPPHTLENQSHTLESLIEILADESQRTDQMLDEFQRMNRTLERIADILETQRQSQSRDIGTPSRDQRSALGHYQTVRKSQQPSKNKTGEQSPSVLQELTDLYNADKQSELQKGYKNHRIGVVNIEERRRTPNKPPVFTITSDGNFLAYSIGQGDFYAVFPIYGLVLQNAIYDSGAFRDVFDCPNFDSQCLYDIKVIRPAFFKLDPTDKQWIVHQKGELELYIKNG